MSYKKQLLDPIGTMCRIITLNFKSKGTRIGNNNHAITIQEFSSIQWIQRKMNGDERDNISSLFPVIMRIIEWYITPLYGLKFGNVNTTLNDNINLEQIDSKNHNNNNNLDNYLVVGENLNSYWDYMYKLSVYMCMGLEKLQETYESGNVIYSIQFYINLIMDALNGQYTRNKLPKCNLKNESKNFLDYNKLKNLWNYKKVKEICELFDKCFDVYKDENENDNYKKDKIYGYLHAIDHLLNITEVDFRELIETSL